MKLTYYAARGTCEQIRILLAEVGLEYKEWTLSPNEYASMKHDIPFEQLPMWEEDTLRIVHAGAIMRHLARKANMYGETEAEKAELDMWDEQCEMVIQGFWNAEFQEEDCSSFKLEQLKEDYMNRVLVPQLRAISALMVSSKGSFLGGNKLTYVDVKLFATLETINRELPLVLPCFPLLGTFYKMIAARPNVREYLANGRKF